MIYLAIETTGLDPRTGLLLEWAVATATKEFEVGAVYSGVVRQRLGALDGLQIDYKVKRMHAENGLWEAVTRDADALLDDADETLVSLCEAGELTGGLVAMSPHWVRSWLDVHLPAFSGAISGPWDDIDVRSLWRARQLWAPFRSADGPPAKRAESKVRRNIYIARGFAETLRRGQQ